MKNTKEMLINAIKEMKDAERRAKVLEKMVELKKEIDESWKVRDELSEKQRFDMIDKYGLMQWLEDEKITNIKVKESIIKTFEMIKQLEKTAKDELYSYVWESIYGRIEIESSIDNMLIEQHIYIRGDELSLNNLDDKYDSVESAFEKIRINLHDAHREREERLKNPSKLTLKEILG
ncbi:hypothetical protein [Bacillus toyonensis]|uniref:Uncharacterized protein n=1 Tax=Bacillus toyonensis TaxID=155322 RepID=A0A2C4PXT6_9BACI|nr:hypothetical protein [Bacillus toyonensis]PHD69865.1 hypothetical protein COF40_14315 [Bacillus toyonensis]